MSDHAVNTNDPARRSTTNDSTPSTQPGSATDSMPARPLILVGVDASEDGLRAARYAARSALAVGGDVLLVHAVDDAVIAGAWGVVYDPGMMQVAAEEGMETACAAVVNEGLPRERVQTKVALGNAAAVLARMSEQASLLVVGRRSVSGVERMFVGSTSVAVAAMAHCPVLVISQASNPDVTGTKGLVVAGLDAGPHTARTLRLACAEAQRRGARLEVVHSSEPTGGGLFGLGRSHDKERAAELQAARQGITELVESTRRDFPDLQVDVAVAPGNPVDALVARTGHADLLVLGMVSNRTTHQLGGVVRGLMAHSQAPVLLVP